MFIINLKSKLIGQLIWLIFRFFINFPLLPFFLFWLRVTTADGASFLDLAEHGVLNKIDAGAGILHRLRSIEGWTENLKSLTLLSIETRWSSTLLNFFIFLFSANPLAFIFGDVYVATPACLLFWSYINFLNKFSIVSSLWSYVLWTSGARIDL